MQVTEVVAALIWDGARFMVCQRPPQKARGMMWELVGGKVESGEAPEQALIRECREELGITIRVDARFAAITYDYPDLTIHLQVYCWNILIFAGFFLMKSMRIPSALPMRSFCRSYSKNYKRRIYYATFFY